MLDAAIKALSQMFSPPFRAVLLKSIGLALVLIVLIGIGLQRLLVWLATAGESWAEGMLGATRPRAAGLPRLDLVDRGRRSASSSARSS